MVSDKAEEADWKCSGVNEHWPQMKNLMMETAKDICGMSKFPCRHKETWWCNEEVDEAVMEKKIKYVNWKREKSTEAWKEYKKSRQNAKEKKQEECAGNLDDSEHQNETFRMAKQMVRERQNITGSNCLKGVSGTVILIYNHLT